MSSCWRFLALCLASRIKRKEKEGGKRAVNSYESLYTFKVPPLLINNGPH